MKTICIDKMESRLNLLEMLKNGGGIQEIEYKEIKIEYKNCSHSIAERWISFLDNTEIKEIMRKQFIKMVEEEIQRLKPLATQEIYEMMNIIGGAR